MQKLHMFLPMLIVISASAYAQPDTLWTKTFGGSENDCGLSGQQTTDGGFIIAGGTYSFGAGSDDVYLVKTDVNGDTMWTRTFGGFSIDYGHSVQQTADGGYIIVGDTFSGGAGDCDIYLIKTDTGGNEIWTRTHGGVGRDAGNFVQQTLDGGYVIVAETWSFGPGEESIYFIKTDSNGDTLWTKVFGGFNCDEGLSVRQTSDRGYIIVGATNSYTTAPWFFDVYLIKTDEEGNLLWERTYGGDHSDIGYDVQQTSDGGYIFVGGTVSYGAGQCDIYLIKTDALGDTLWTRTFGSSGCEEGYSVQQTFDGGYIIAGYANISQGNDCYLLKTDASGNEEWHQTFGGNGSDTGHSVQQTVDGGYFIAGHTNSFGAGLMDIYIIRLESELEPIALTLTPHNPPIQIPASGGFFDFDVEIANNSTIAYIIDFETNVTLPGGVIYPILTRDDIYLAAGEVIIRDDLIQYIPLRAPAGNYSYNAYVYDHSTGELLTEDSFPFEKLAGDNASNHDFGWALFGWDEETTVNEQVHPSSFILYPCHPNPFNPETAISYQLSAPSVTTLNIFDVHGRLVAELVNGWRDAGLHQVTFDGSNLTSGIYLYSVQASEFKASGKMVLMK